MVARARAGCRRGSWPARWRNSRSLTQCAAVEASTRVRSGRPTTSSAPVHPVALDDGRERGLELVAVGGRLDLQAHEEAAGVGAGELLALGDVAARRDDGAADGVHDAGPVGADEGDDPVVVDAARGMHGGVEVHPLRLSRGSRARLVRLAGVIDRGPGRAQRRVVDPQSSRTSRRVSVTRGTPVGDSPCPRPHSARRERTAVPLGRPHRPGGRRLPLGHRRDAPDGPAARDERDLGVTRVAGRPARHASSPSPSSLTSAPLTAAHPRIPRHALHGRGHRRARRRATCSRRSLRTTASSSRPGCSAGMAHGLFWAIVGAYAAHLVPKEQIAPRRLDRPRRRNPRVRVRRAARHRARPRRRLALRRSRSSPASPCCAAVLVWRFCRWCSASSRRT